VTPRAQDTSTGEVVIDVRGLNKRFGANHAVKDLTLQVRRGEIFGFLGPNGSGKTTSIRMLCGLLTPDSGEGSCLGYDILTQTKEIKRHAGYMTQRFSFWEDLTIRENLRFIARMYGMADGAARVDRALAQLGLASRANQLAGSLSGGWKQRLALAACLLHDPQLLLLDEPTAGVDEPGQERLTRTIQRLQQEEGVTVLLISHDLMFVHSYANAVLCLSRDYTCFGTPRKVLTADHLTEIYGEPVGLHVHDAPRG
jgi:ABC-2 type transport system ATP-binding protein